MVEDEHPYHMFETDDNGVLNGTLHRDGSMSKYIKDPSGNTIELIKYPTKTKHFRWISRRSLGKISMKEIKKNSQEIIRIESKEYKGNKFLDCRVYFLDKETQEYRPTKKGISFNHGV